MTRIVDKLGSAAYAILIPAVRARTSASSTAGVTSSPGARTGMPAGTAR